MRGSIDTAPNVPTTWISGSGEIDEWWGLLLAGELHPRLSLFFYPVLRNARMPSELIIESAIAQLGPTGFRRAAACVSSVGPVSWGWQVSLILVRMG